MRRGLPFLTCLVLLAAPAKAETRLAIVVGRNDGAADRVPLRHAVDDARRMAKALVQYARVSGEDLWLLDNKPGLLDLWQTIDKARRRLLALERDGSDTLLFFYFSGHSDGLALELGQERVLIEQLHTKLAGLARVRVEILDTCRGAGLPRGPGDVPEITLYDPKLETEGWAILTAADRNENAREWPGQGGIFTHHLILALRWADEKGNGDGDGKVSLGEAFKYAAERTLWASARAGKPHHPQINTQLTGARATVILADVTPPDARIQLPDGFDAVFLFEEGGAEVCDHKQRNAVQIEVHAGRYLVLALRGNERRKGAVQVRAGETRVVRAKDLYLERALVALAGKGEEGRLHVQPTPRYHLALAVGGGVQGPLTRAGVDLLASLQLGLRAAGPSGWMVLLDLGTGPAPTWGVETTLLGLAGYRLGHTWGRLTAAIGLLGGAGLAVQTITVQEREPGLAPALVAAPWAGIALRLSGRVDLILENLVPLGWSYFGQENRCEHDSTQCGSARHEFVYLPGGWLGLLARL
jgi:hypothetical protein